MKKISGSGLGLRREHLFAWTQTKKRPDWFEVTPENWMVTPIIYQEAFEQLAQEKPLVAHGVSLSIGSPEAIDMSFLSQMKTFLDRYKIEYYSEHISFSSLAGKQTYELLPLPMTPKMVEHISDKAKQVQDFLDRELILEHASYYYSPYSEMAESDFINEIIARSGSKLLLDINNVYVNATNHGFDAKAYIRSMPLDKVAYMHIAGHLKLVQENILLDTHGEPISSDVWKLLEYTLKYSTVPVMIERDNNIPALTELWKEYKQLKSIVKEAL